MSSGPKLADVCIEIIDCEHKTAPEDPNGDAWSIGTPAMDLGRIDDKKVRLISAQTLEAWTRRGAPRPGDLIVAREAPVGAVVRVPAKPKVALGQRTVLLRPDPAAVCDRYLQYLLLGAEMQHVMASLADGSTVAHLNVADIRHLPLPLLPPLHEQDAIAEVLGALDDKIESNRRTIQLASDLCDARFLDWRSRHLPLDVETTFGDFCDVFGGATPKTSEPDYWGGTHAWSTPSDVTALGSVYLFGTGRTITDEGLDRCSASLHPPGSIFMTSRATIGAFAVNQIPCVPNQGFIVVRPKDATHRWFLFHEMRRRVPEMLDRANGSTFQELSRGSFKEMSLLVPTGEAAFASLDRGLSPLHERACIAARESEVAAVLRDALLPELLSGRIRVPGVSKLVEGAS